MWHEWLYSTLTVYLVYKLMEKKTQSALGLSDSKWHYAFDVQDFTLNRKAFKD